MIDERAVCEIVGLLSGTAIFAGAGDTDALVREYGRVARYARGETVFSPERYERALGLIISGRLCVAKGRAHISELGRGELFGAVAIFGGEDYYVTAITAKTESSVLFLGREAMSEYMHTHTDIAENYIKYLCERIYFLNAKIDSFTAGAADGGLAAFLLRNAAERGEGPCVEIKNRSELAKRLCISRASLYRALAALEGRGAIRCEGSDIIVVDRGKLAEAVSS